MELCVLLASPGISVSPEAGVCRVAPSPEEFQAGGTTPHVALRFSAAAGRGTTVSRLGSEGGLAREGQPQDVGERLPVSQAQPSNGDDRHPDDILDGSSLEQLMSAYVAGSERAFDELYRRLTPKVYGYLLRLARKPERAEDLVQVTYSKLHRARASYLEGAPLLPWVLAIARRAFFDDSRALRSRREDLTNEGVLPEASTAVGEEPDTALLERGLAAIPEGYREAIVLTKITGLSVTEAAAVVESTPSAVKLRVHRGYKALREAMERLARDDAAV